MGRREKPTELAAVAAGSAGGSKAAHDPNPKFYHQAATQRLGAALRLLETPYRLDAVYRGGYVVECALKWLILQNTPSATRRDAYEELSNPRVAGHDFGKLVRILHRKGVVVSDRVLERIQHIQPRWHSAIRYQGALVPFGEAKTFLDHVEAVFTWAEGAR